MEDFKHEVGLVEGNWGILYDNTPSKVRVKTKLMPWGRKTYLNTNLIDYTTGIWAKIEVLV